jgi:hypothetical protein
MARIESVKEALLHINHRWRCWRGRLMDFSWVVYISVMTASSASKKSLPVWWMTHHSSIDDDGELDGLDVDGSSGSECRGKESKIRVG